MTRFFVQEGLNKWLIIDRETGRTIEAPHSKSKADDRADEMNRRKNLTLSVNRIYSDLK